MKRASVLLFVVAIVLCAASAVRAELIFTQDFEDSIFVVGNTLTTTGVGDSATTVGKWRMGPRSGSNGEGPKVVSDFSHSGSKAMYLTRTSGQSKKMEGYTSMTGTPLNSGIFEVSTWLRKDDSGSTTMLLTNHADHAVNSALTCTGLFVNTGGALNYRSADNTAWTPISGITITDENWFGLKMVVDLDSEKFDVWYNSGAGWSEVLSDAGLITAYEGTHDVDCVIFQPSSPDNGKIWIDDCTLQTIPEPSTLALLAAGLFGLLAYAWRKRK